MPRGVREVRVELKGWEVWEQLCVCFCFTLQLTFHLGQQLLPQVASVCGFKRQVLDKLRRRLRRRRWLQASLGNKCVSRSSCLCSSISSSWMDSHNDRDQQIKKEAPTKQVAAARSNQFDELTRVRSLGPAPSLSLSRSLCLSVSAQNRQRYVSRRPWGPKLLVLRQPTVSLGAHAHARSPIQRKSNRIQIETESLAGYSTVPTFDLLPHRDLSFSVAITHTIRYAYDLQHSVNRLKNALKRNTAKFHLCFFRLSMRKCSICITGK